MDRLFSHFSSHNLEENYIATQATLLNMQLSFLVQKWERARDSARNLINVKPIKQEAVNYILGNAQEAFSLQDFEKVRMRLEEDHPLESWAWLRIALIETYFIKNFEASWIAIKKSLDLASSHKEKVSAVQLVFDIGQDLDRIDEAMALIDDALPSDDLWHQFFSAWFHYIKNNSETAERLLAEIEANNPPPELIARVKLLSAQQAIRQERWEKARQLLEESCQIFYNPLTLKELLFILTKLQDDSEALRIAEELESLGIIDWQVIGVKAQAARNLGLFRKSAEAWQRLVDQFPERPEYAYNLAGVRFQLDEEKEALKVLEKFIQCDDKTHPDCLLLAVSIYEAKSDYQTAYELLGHCQAHIVGHSNLLLKYLELGYRTDNEEEANWALMRLELLRQEGKVPEETFSKVPFEKLTEMLKERRESLDKINNSYRLAQIPRLMLCGWKNMPMYLDWAVRTQKLQLSSDPNQWIDFTTYATNSLKVEFTRKRGNQLIIITAPTDDEIVIDYHALITLHRLDLFKKLEKRYSKIYYPRSLKDLMLAELGKFGHLQLSEEKAFRSLNDKLLTGQIREFTAPELPNAGEHQQDSLTKRNFRLARVEKIPLIDSYLENSELQDFPEVRVLRVSQVVKWLYSKGKLSQKRFNEIKGLSEGEPINKDIDTIMNNAPRLLIAEITIKVMEKLDLLPLLSEVGFQVVVERGTANGIKFAVRELDFGQNVRKWHKDLIDSFSKIRVLKEVIYHIPSKYKGDSRDQYFEVAAASLMYSEEVRLPLLTDDRFTQMISSKTMVNRQFGTDVLLTDMYEKGIITLSEYANYFLQLCQWRYRFLIPDVRIMVFLSKEFRQNPLGKHLQTIADYGRSCMEEPGLFLGPEPTEPPLPCGLKFQQIWLSRWIDFLVLAWQDDDFQVANLKSLTKKVYLQALPEIPKHLKVEVRERLASFNVTSIIKHLLINVIDVKNDPRKLHGLFQQTFEVFGIDEKKQISELKVHLEFLHEFVRDEKIKNKKKELAVRRAYYIRALQAFLGEKLTNHEIDSSLIPILSEAGIIEQKDIIANQDGTELSEERPDVILRENLPQYFSKGPLIFVPSTQEEPGTLLVLHDLIMASAREMRIDAFKRLMKQKALSPFTKEFLELRREALFSGNIQIWLPAAKEVAENLLNDYYYVSSLFIEVSNLPVPDQDLINLAWNHLLKPGLDSILNKMPLLIDGDLDTPAAKQRITADLIAEFTQKSDSQHSLTTILEWYFANIYFIPLGPPLNPWQVIMHFYETISVAQKANENISMQLKAPSSTEILLAVKDWVDKNYDPLTYLMALELVLIARENAAKDEQYLFTGDIFYDFINKVLRVLLNVEERGVGKIADLSMHSFNIIWQIRLMLAQYYLKYIDLHDKRNIPEEKKVGLAWWLAKEVLLIILKSLKLRGLSEQDQIILLDGNIKNTIGRADNFLSITHLFIDQRKYYSLPRYNTLFNSLLLSTMTIALLDPKSTAFDGLTHPSRALSPDLRDLIINRLVQASLSEGQLFPRDENGLPLLWNTPLCVSGPAFLRAYYEGAIEFLGQEKLDVIALAEDVSRRNFLADHLPNLPKYIDKKELSILVLTFNLLRNYIFTNDTIPNEINIFEKDKLLLRKLSFLDDNLLILCLNATALILKKLQASGEINWTKIFIQQFNQLDYTEYSDTVLENVVPELLGVALLGADYSLLTPIFVCKSSDRRMRRLLGKFKEWLVYAFPQVPDAYRENARRVLNDLEEIPIPDREEEGNGSNK